MTERHLGHEPAVDTGAVDAVEIADPPAPKRVAEALGVAARDRLRRELDRRLLRPSEDDALALERVFGRLPPYVPNLDEGSG